MDGDVGAGIAAGDPFGELPGGDRLRLQQRAVAVVDVLQDAVDDERAELLVVGVEAACDRRPWPARPGSTPMRSSSSSSASERTDGFSISTCLPASRPLGSGEVSIVGRGDADERRPARPAVARRLCGSVKLLKLADLAWLLGDRPRRAAGALAGDGGQLHFADAEAAGSYRPTCRAMDVLEERAIRFVENHAHADHADNPTSSQRCTGKAKR